MKTSISYAPMNSIVFVHGGPDEVPPWPVWGAQIVATNSCISPACFPEIDGPSEIVLGDADEVDPGRAPDLVSLLRVPDGDLRVTTVGDVAACDEDDMCESCCVRDHNEAIMPISSP